MRTRLLNAQSQRRQLEADLRNSVADYIEAVGQAPGDVSRPEVPIAALPVSLDEALPIAMENSFELRASAERERAAALTAESAKGALFPALDLELAHERRENTDGTRGEETDSSALVRFSWDFYAGGRLRATRRRALQERNQAMFRKDEINRLLRQDLAFAVNDYQAAQDRVALQEDRLTTAREVRTAYQQQFRLAQRSTLDLLNSSQEVFIAERDLIATRYEVLQTAFAILAVSGTLLTNLDIDVETESEDR